jgi:hypothetical protein
MAVLLLMSENQLFALMCANLKGRQGTFQAVKQSQIDTMCRFELGQKPDLLWLDSGSVHQHDRDSVLDRIDAITLAAFQASPIRFLGQRQLTDGTHQNIEKILGGHHRNIVAPTAYSPIVSDPAGCLPPP